MQELGSKTRLCLLKIGSQFLVWSASRGGLMTCGARLIFERDGRERGQGMNGVEEGGGAAPMPDDVVEVIDDSEEEDGAVLPEVVVVGQHSSSAPQSGRRSQDGSHMQRGAPASAIHFGRNVLSAPVHGVGDLEANPAAEGPVEASPLRSAQGPGPSAPPVEGVPAPDGGGAVAIVVADGGGAGAAQGQGQGQVQSGSVHQEVAASPGKRDRDEEAEACTICLEPFANSGAGHWCSRPAMRSRDCPQSSLRLGHWPLRFMGETRVKWVQWMRFCVL